MVEIMMCHDIYSVLIIINKLLVNFSPIYLIFWALCNANKMASMVELTSLVQAQTTGGRHKSERHINIAIILLATIACTAGAPISLFITIDKQYHSELMMPQEIIFALIIILILGIITAVILEITDLTERLTTCLAGSEDSRHNIEQALLFKKIFINTDCIVSQERLLRMLNEAAREAENYLRMPLLLIGGEGFLNILIICYIMTQSTTPVQVTNMLFLASFVGRSWCAMHVIDLYKSKVSCDHFSLCEEEMCECPLKINIVRDM